MNYGFTTKLFSILRDTYLHVESNCGLYFSQTHFFKTILNLLLNFGVLVAVSSASAITEDTLLLVHSSIHSAAARRRHTIEFQL